MARVQRKKSSTEFHKTWQVELQKKTSHYNNDNNKNNKTIIIHSKLPCLNTLYTWNEKQTLLQNINVHERKS